MYKSIDNVDYLRNKSTWAPNTRLRKTIYTIFIFFYRFYWNGFVSVVVIKLKWLNDDFANAFLQMKKIPIRNGTGIDFVVVKNMFNVSTGDWVSACYILHFNKHFKMPLINYILSEKKNRKLFNATNRFRMSWTEKTF